MSNPMIQLLVLAAIAVFLILRLRGVLGTRDGFEPVQSEHPTPEHPEVIEATADPAEDHLADYADPGSATYHALRDMQAVEPSFDPGAFLSGAKSAYEMILMAFERGDLEPVRPFLAAPVADAFQQVIDRRTAAGHTVEAQFLGARETALAAAQFDPANREGELSVRFVGELITATHDSEGTLIEGDPKAPRKQRDIWTFARQMGSDDPNWQLVATGA